MNSIFEMNFFEFRCTVLNIEQDTDIDARVKSTDLFALT